MATLVLTRSVQAGEASGTTVVLSDVGPPGNASYTQITPVAQHNIVSGVFDMSYLVYWNMVVSVVGENGLRVAVSYPTPGSPDLR